MRVVSMSRVHLPHPSGETRSARGLRPGSLHKRKRDSRGVGLARSCHAYAVPLAVCPQISEQPISGIPRIYQAGLYSPRSARPRARLQLRAANQIGR
jgi:hypothetical protein